MATATPRRRAYHHGDLPAALVDATLELIAENGVQNFSVAEAARRTGVSISAPYKHFADRDALLAAAAVRGYDELAERFSGSMADNRTPSDRLAAAAGAYVRFAAEQRPLFELLFSAGLDKHRYPPLEQAAARLVGLIAEVALRLAPGRDEELAMVLVQAMAGLAQGHATMLLDSGLAGSAEAVDLAARRAEAAARALVRGRSLLFEGA